MASTHSFPGHSIKENLNPKSRSVLVCICWACLCLKCWCWLFGHCEWGEFGLWSILLVSCHGNSALKLKQECWNRPWKCCITWRSPVWLERDLWALWCRLQFVGFLLFLTFYVVLELLRYNKIWWHALGFIIHTASYYKSKCLRMQK